MANKLLAFLPLDISTIFSFFKELRLKRRQLSLITSIFFFRLGEEQHFHEKKWQIHVHVQIHVCHAKGAHALRKRASDSDARYLGDQN